MLCAILNTAMIVYVWWVMSKIYRIQKTKNFEHFVRNNDARMRTNWELLERRKQKKFCDIRKKKKIERVRTKWLVRGKIVFIAFSRAKYRYKRSKIPREYSLTGKNEIAVTSIFTLCIVSMCIVVVWECIYRFQASLLSWVIWMLYAGLIMYFFFFAWRSWLLYWWGMNWELRNGCAEFLFEFLFFVKYISVTFEWKTYKVRVESIWTKCSYFGRVRLFLKTMCLYSC